MYTYMYVPARTHITASVSRTQDDTELSRDTCRLNDRDPPIVDRHLDRGGGGWWKGGVSAYERCNRDDARSSGNKYVCKHPWYRLRWLTAVTSTSSMSAHASHLICGFTLLEVSVSTALQHCFWSTCRVSSSTLSSGLLAMCCTSLKMIAGWLEG